MMREAWGLAWHAIRVLRCRQAAAAAVFAELIRRSCDGTVAGGVAVSVAWCAETALLTRRAGDALRTPWPLRDADDRLLLAVRPVRRDPRRLP